MRAVLFAALSAFCSISGFGAGVEVTWTFSVEDDTYRNDETGLSFPKSIAGFDRKRATPANEDGSASFSYQCASGVVTLYLVHESIYGGDMTEETTLLVRKIYVDQMHASHGESNSEQEFGLSLVLNGVETKGVGTICHFVNSPAIHAAVYSEFGCVPIGDFAFNYRASFPQKDGLDDLQRFLTALGFQKKIGEPGATDNPGDAQRLREDH